MFVRVVCEGKIESVCVCVCLRNNIGLEVLHVRVELDCLIQERNQSQYVN